MTKRDQDEKRPDQDAGVTERDEAVRDFGATGDVGSGGHSAFAQDRDDDQVLHNDERLGNRGRNPGRDESGFLEETDNDRNERLHRHDAGPGTVRGLSTPNKDDVGA